MEPILEEWQAFATSLGPAADGMSRKELRDHAREMLSAIAADLAQDQTASAQAEKSKGQALADPSLPHTAAQLHGSLRAHSGFNINQMVAEYRALRASVLRLWGQQIGNAVTDLGDVIRFGEAIDQAVAESISHFTTELDTSRNLLLGMLGHDMRNPLNVIRLTAAFLKKLNAGENVSVAAGRLISSGSRIKALLDDLVDFNRTNLGVGINVQAAKIDLGVVFGEQVNLLRAAFPGRRLDLEVSGNVEGICDANRMHQLLGNLTSNALKYGAPQGTVRVTLRGEQDAVVFDVANEGPPIPPNLLKFIFDPLRRAAPDLTGDARDDGSLGLGLYVAKEIVKAHGGQIGVSSDDTETVFSIWLPRTRP